MVDTEITASSQIFCVSIVYSRYSKVNCLYNIDTLKSCYIQTVINFVEFQVLTSQPHSLLKVR